MLKLIPESKRVWIAVLVALVVVLLIGTWVFRTVETPSERAWDYGTVPFVPAESHYSDHRVELPPLPNPEATRPTSSAAGGQR